MSLVLVKKKRVTGEGKEIRTELCKNRIELRNNKKYKIIKINKNRKMILRNCRAKISGKNKAIPIVSI